MSPGRRQLSAETLVLASVGLAFVAIGAFVCVSAYRAGQAPGADVVVQAAPALPPALPAAQAPGPPPAPGPVFAPAPGSIFTPPPLVEAYAPPARKEVSKPSRPPPSPVFETPTSPSIALGPAVPVPPRRPIQLNAPPPAPTPTPTPGAPAARPTEVAALSPSQKPASLDAYDRFTAVYDLTAHTVYLPDGRRLEAHSGLGSIKDDPTHVEEKDRGATPPHVYDLTLREDLFHGVQALRLNPVGGSDSIFGRAGLLAHTYMLGPNGDSNGCVSFKDYDAFLQAFQNGVVKRLAVVAGLK